MAISRTWLATILLVAGAGTAVAGPMASEPAVTDSAEAGPDPAAETTARKIEEELKLPPGFKKVKRGKHLMYCKKEAPIGTRFKTDTCFDEAGMRNYILALEETKGDVDRMRSTCSNYCVCGGDC